MAAIDKIYIGWKDYVALKTWCDEQPSIVDKYGKKTYLRDWLWQLDEKSFMNENGTYYVRPVMNNPYYIDAYIIRNCPIDAVQRELMTNYGHKTQDDLREMYNVVKNRKPEIQKLIDDANGDYPDFPKDFKIDDTAYWWLNVDDFIIDENNNITIKDAGESDYELIKKNMLFATPDTDKYERGKHFKMIKMPDCYKGNVCQRPMCGTWMIDVKLPEYVDELFMSWHAHSDAKFSVGTWDFASEFVISHDGWSSSATNCKTIHALKRRITKWNLPIGTIVRAIGRYVGEEYEFIVTK